jgi:hypothetical protein
MFVIRYVALAALAIWLGGTVALILLATPSRPATASFDCVATACGALIVVCLLVMKFVGPPPVAFIPRLAIAVAMLALVGYGRIVHGDPLIPASLDAALGFVLLSWYARE